jgi:hypothetical protein
MTALQSMDEGSLKQVGLWGGGVRASLAAGLCVSCLHDSAVRHRPAECVLPCQCLDWVLDISPAHQCSAEKAAV